MSINSPFFLAGIEAEKIEDEATDDSEIGSGIFGTGPHLVVVQCDVESPMDTVLDAPMSSHRVPHNDGIWGDAADVQAPLTTGFTVNRPLRLDHPEHFQVWPLLWLE